ncbi:MAG: hypothetical protein MJ237_07755 [bacterium]|nr:hypothetical protein [bacterium]
MNKRFIIFLVFLLTATLSAKANDIDMEMSDFTGESFFVGPVSDTEKSDKELKHGRTTPPLKQLRLTIQNKLKEKENDASEFAPMMPVVNDNDREEYQVSEFVSKELKDDFDDIQADGFEADEEKIQESQRKGWFNFRNKKTKKNTMKDGIVLDCESMDYDTPNHTLYANGNVSINFVEQDTVIKADQIAYDRLNNTIKADGNVKIIKNNRAISGDYIFVDMNEENAYIENPEGRTQSVAIFAEKGYVYGDKIIQENGEIKVTDHYKIKVDPSSRGLRAYNNTFMSDEAELVKPDQNMNVLRLSAKKIVVTQKGEHETVAIRGGKIFRNDKLTLKLPPVKLYTNKNHDYVESNIWEIGSYKGLGMYTGPGFVFELPKGSVLKAIPMLNYKSGIGVGGMGRFSSGTNQTTVAYGTAADRVVAYGEQKLDDNLRLEYSVNAYMDEWFLGRRRPKYGAGLIYEKDYSADNFLLKDHNASFRHRFDMGYYHDSDINNSADHFKSTNIGTTRFRYMAQGTQNLWNYKNTEKQTAFSFNIVSQLAASVYGTGDTQVIGRIGPNIHLQYKRWMQDAGYMFAAYDDNTPYGIYDMYRYGKQSLYLREYFRICKWLTVSWFSTVNMTGDSPNDRTFQENAFYLTLGPEYLKVHLGYDWLRSHLRCMVSVMLDAKDSSVEYEKLEIKQDKPSDKKKTASKNYTQADYQAPVQPKELQRAVVENLKVTVDVL